MHLQCVYTHTHTYRHTHKHNMHMYIKLTCALSYSTHTLVCSPALSLAPSRSLSLSLHSVGGRALQLSQFLLSLLPIIIAMLLLLLPAYYIYYALLVVVVVVVVLVYNNNCAAYGDTRRASRIRRGRIELKFVVAFDRAVSAVAAPFNTHTPLTLCLSPPPRTHPSSEWLKLRLGEAATATSAATAASPTLTVDRHFLRFSRTHFHPFSILFSLSLISLFIICCLPLASCNIFLFVRPLQHIIFFDVTFSNSFFVSTCVSCCRPTTRMGEERDTLLSSVLLLPELSKWHIKLLFCCYRTNSASLRLCYR